jgi:hypothetical protein
VTADVFTLDQHRESEARRKARSAALTDECIYTLRAQAASLRYFAARDDLHEEHRQAALHRAADMERNAAGLERSRTNGRIGPEDHAHVSALLPVIAGVFGSRRITARDILNAAASENGAGLRIVLHTTSARSLGKLLARCDGIEVNGYKLLRIGTDHRSVAWGVERVG